MSESSISIINTPSPIQRVRHPFLETYDVRLYVKREDLIHPLISGNKWRKLKYNLLPEPHGVITFGGAFSNHIHATAAAGEMFSIPTVGIIRGDADPSNPTLLSASKMGMKLHHVSRSAYRQKEKAAEVIDIMGQYPDFRLVPEGGSNEAAGKGLSEMTKEILDTDQSFDVIAVSAGTGATARSIVSDVHDRDIWICSALKGQQLEQEFGIVNDGRVVIDDRFHFGGYGMVTEELINFIEDFYLHTGIPLDPIYNGKLVYGVFDNIRKGTWQDVSVLWVHTGGLQGIDAYNYLAEKKGKRRIIFDGCN